MDGTQVNPKLSVCVITYNHAKYIRKCLQSIVDQETNFRFEIIVGDDFSTDGTREIVKEFAGNYPEIVRPIFHKKNIGGANNYLSVHEFVNGEYVAHIDGDDYALPGKLQAQADFLDKNPECSIVWHRMHTLWENEGRMYADNFCELGLLNLKFGIDEIIMNITIGLHSSQMYRRTVTSDLPHYDLDVLDFSENVLHLHAARGYACFLDDKVYGVYRAGLGVHNSITHIRNLIYDWLCYFYVNRIANRSTVNAKIFWMLLSDLRHRQGSFQRGMILFLKTIRYLNPAKIMHVRKHIYQSSIKFKSMEPESEP